MKRKSLASSIESECDQPDDSKSLSVTSDIYANESDTLLEKHLSLAMSDSAGLPDLTNHEPVTMSDSAGLPNRTDQKPVNISDSAGLPEPTNHRPVTMADSAGLPDSTNRRPVIMADSTGLPNLTNHISVTMSDSSGLPDLTNHVQVTMSASAGLLDPTNHLSVNQQDDSQPPSVCSDEAPSSDEVLRTINEDLDRIRNSMKKALQNESSINREPTTPKQVEITIPSGLCSPTEKFDQMVCYDDDDEIIKKTSDYDEVADCMLGSDSCGASPRLKEPEPLPKRSICVDSGRVMEEEEFYQSPNSSNDSGKMKELDNNPELDLSYCANVNEYKKGHLERSLSVSFDNELSVYNSDAESGSHDEILITRKQLKEDEADRHNQAIADSAPRVGNRETNDEAMKDELIEPLLRSKKIPLRMKLQCLASLYSSDDMEQTELQHTPLTPPYVINSR